MAALLWDGTETGTWTLWSRVVGPVEDAEAHQACGASVCF